MLSAENVGSLFKGAIGLLGLLIGYCLMYMIKGINTCAIINIAKEFVYQFIII